MDLRNVHTWTGVHNPQGNSFESSTLGYRASVGDESALSVIRGQLHPRVDLWHAVALAGGGQTTGVMTVQHGEVVKLDLHELGLPRGYRALRLVQTPYRLMVFLAPMSQILGGRGALPEVQFVKPLPTGPGDGAWEGQKQVEINYLIPWAPAEVTRSQELLVSALTAWADADMVRAAIDAHSALDRALQELARPLLASIAAPKLRFGWEQCLALAELLARARDLSTLTPEVRAGVRALAKLRNGRAAHGGGAVTELELVEPMTAAVAAWWWCAVTAPQLSEP